MKNRLLVVSVLVLALVFLAGCDMSMQGSAVSRGIGTLDSAVAPEGVKQQKKPTAFTASVNVYQDYKSVVTEHKGESDHYKTVAETLYSVPYGSFGGAIVSDWDLLNGKYVIMDNITNYNLDGLSGELAGSNHSVIKIMDEGMQVVATLEANGTIKGSLLGAELSMNWVLKDSSLAGLNARGKITGTFTWAVFNYETMELEYILPNGTFSLTGTYQ
ncbi:MAG: hypothetical protein AB7C91_10620 [Sphaerochaeta sp.]|jgi:hypothetical protein|uniref:hypothetical protein n=1 Tax=Sphaerochaeta sp. TaxID=1972642 RepID=UPI002FC60825